MIKIYYHRLIVLTGSLFLVFLNSYASGNFPLPHTINNSSFQATLFGGIITSSASAISSGGSVTLSSSADATGGSCGGAYAYQYQSSTDEQNWTNISGTTVSNITQTTWFRRQATCGSDIAYSNTVSVKVKAAAPATILPDGSTAPLAGTATSIPMPGYGTVDANNMNYIKTRTFTKAGITDLTTANSITDDNAVHQTTEYFDGLGRSIQSVSMHATPQGHDMIATTFYDDFGRVAQQYLPYTDGGASGGFRTDAATQQPSFYNTQFNNTEGYFYSNTIYEPSPLNRVLKTTAPGNSWTGHDVGVSAFTRTNDVYDSVRIWNIGYNEDDLPTSTAVYNPGTLYVNETTDENGNKVVEYKDLEGQVILKKVQQADAELPGHYGWLCTYYVYNDLNELCFVMPPRAVEYLLANNWTVTLALRDNLCFSYLYDGRKRLIVKTTPNAGKSQMVYNSRDMLVGSWDAQEGVEGWATYYQYDHLNRLTGTGVVGGPTNDRAGYQAIADTDITFPADFLSPTYLKTQTFYDDYNWVTGTIVSTYGMSASMKTNVYSGFTTSYNASPDFATAPTASNMTRGEVTGTMTQTTNLIGHGQNFYKTNFYDDRGRVIQTQSDNVSAGNAVDYTTTQYDFAGKPLNTYLQENKKGTNPLITGILTHNTYDAQGRLLSIAKTINSGTTKTIATYAYNELGQLQTKSLGTLNGSPLDNLNYTYNIRGWMNSINKAYLNANTSSSSPSAGNYFGMELDYDFGFNQNQLNGNIAGAKWKSAGDQYARAFGYDYDNVNRILKGDFTQTQTGSGYAQDAKVDFSVSGISYDANGNIMSLKRNGLLIGSSSPIDNLTYKYSGNSAYTNQLSSVSDAVSVNNHLGDFYDANTADNDYTYDANGSLASDKNKGISSITHDYMSLPEVVTFTGKGTITYLYDADGNKLEKTVVDNTVTPSKTTTTKYINGFVYQNDTLQFINHEEGRIRFLPSLGGAGGGWVYDYFEKDHLGNVRMVLTEKQDTAFYPAATMETAQTTTEEALYANLPETRTAISTVPGYPTDNTTSPNNEV
ncbi:MAG TPA: DUF6443 domain-containing protein, partial [Hanamia sp.]|nr:DUF6443 domain-containing protein [Hanamia sp.]